MAKKKEVIIPEKTALEQQSAAMLVHLLHWLPRIKGTFEGRSNTDDALIDELERVVTAACADGVNNG